MNYIYGIGSVLIGTYFLLVGFDVFNTKIQKRKKLLPILKIFAVFLILSGLYDLFAPNVGRYNLPSEQTTKREWTEKDRQTLIETCIRDSKPLANEYPELTRAYCECGMDTVMASMSYQEYVADLKKSTAYRVKKIMPLIGKCRTEFEQKIKNSENGR